MNHTALNICVFRQVLNRLKLSTRNKNNLFEAIVKGSFDSISKGIAGNG
jgi:hypothetical protein